MSAYATHFSPTPTLTLPRNRLGLPYWAVSVGVHLAVLATGSALLPPSTPAALTLTVAIGPAYPGARSAPARTMPHAEGASAPVAKSSPTPALLHTPSQDQSHAPSYATSHLPSPGSGPETSPSVMPASSEPAVSPVAITAPGATALAEKPVADSQWLSNTVTQRMNARKRYPRLAQRLGLEGRVLIEAQINDRGQLVAAHVTESSGHDMLDQDALALLKNVTPLDLPAVRLASLTRVLIPLRYQLE